MSDMKEVVETAENNEVTIFLPLLFRSYLQLCGKNITIS